MNKSARRIELAELPKIVPDYKNSNEPKDLLTEKWLTEWINKSVKAKKLKIGELLPIKSKLAYYLGISIGTVQAAFRYMEDKGIVESKQKIGTYIKLSENKSHKKLTGKRDVAISKITEHILNEKIKLGEKIPSIRAYSKLFNLSTNTIRLSLEYLVTKGILKYEVDEKDCFHILQNLPQSKDFQGVEMRTLISKVEDEILNYLKENYKAGDKFMTHHELSKKFGVSIKTAHDAVKSLIKKGYLVARRGQYGTVVVKTSEKEAFQPKPETAIFAPAAEASIYRYSKIEAQLKHLITQDFALGTKLPSMQALSEQLDVSTNTVKKALHNLAKQGYIGFSRGRYGGSFVINVPENQEPTAFRWLAVSQKFVALK